MILNPLNYSEFPVKIQVEEIEQYKLQWSYSIELLYVISGEITVFLNGKDYYLNTEKIMYIEKGMIYGCNTCNEKALILKLQLDSDYFGWTENLAEKSFNYDEFWKDQQERYNHFNKIVSLLSNIVKSYAKQPKGYRSQIISYSYEIICRLIRKDYFSDFNANAATESNDLNYKRISNILSYMEKHLMEDLSLKEIAEKEHISYYYLSSLFKNITGISFREHMNSLRINYALKDLKNSRDSIERIASRYGFKNARGLSKIFKQQYGMLPSEYRKNNLSDLEDNKNAFHKDFLQSMNFDKVYDLLNNLEVQEQVIDTKWTEEVIIDLKKEQDKIRDMEHIWSKMLTCSRASDLLKSNIRALITYVQKELHYKYIRFHGIFNDEMMIVMRGAEGNIFYDWMRVDDIFDFIIGLGMKPYLELSFMPSEIASSDVTIFRYKANITPPKDYREWERLIQELLLHCVERYGLKEVQSWYIDVWSQPDYTGVHWNGSQEEYFKLYEHSVRAVKSVSTHIKVGGPAVTSNDYQNNQWLIKFCEYCKKNKIPVDFVSLHVYTEKLEKSERGDWYTPPMTSQVNIKSDREEDIILHQKEVVRKSGLATNEILVSEWNISPRQIFCVRDTMFMAAFIIKKMLKCSYNISSMAYWALSDVMDEEKIRIREFFGGMGLFNYQGIAKPSWLALKLLNKLGNEVLMENVNYIVTRREQELQILIYNFANLDLFAQENTNFTCDYRGDVYDLFEEKPFLHVKLNIEAQYERYEIEEYILNRKYGSSYDKWVEMGKKEQLKEEQINYLKDEARFRTIRRIININNQILNLECTVPVHGCHMIIIRPEK